MGTEAGVENSFINESGVVPVEYKVLVLPDQVEEKIGSIHVPDTVRDKMKHRTVRATLIAAGGNAWDGWSDPIPSVGDRVYVAIGAGIIHEGQDGKEYRLCNDKDVVGILLES